MSAGPAQPAAAVALPEPFTLEGDIPPRRVPLAYRITLALTAFAMVLLPIAYIGLIILAGQGTLWYARHGGAIFEGSGGGLYRLIGYVGPLFAGASLIFFMIKPLFARPARHAEPLTLDLEEHPHLRALIASICAKVRAPMPTEVRVDCQVNASASLRRGIWSLGRGDLALTIGLPLAGNLTAQQLAGVLAHEFGHFAQGAGMGLTYIIRSVNGWFARVVFERDSWDEQLAEWSEEADWRIAIVLWCARLAIWVSRRILHGLMLLGHAIACLQMRQMEFDADYYETHLAGSEAFVETARELRRLGFTMHAAFNELGTLWQEHQLVDDFPGLIGRRRAQLAPEAAAKIDGEHFSSKTQWFDTHPSDLDRNVQALALKLPGIYQNKAPATTLFENFSLISRVATAQFYRVDLKLDFESTALVPVAAATHHGDKNAAAETARRRLAGETLNLARPLIWTEADFAPPAEIATCDERALSERLATIRAECNAHRPAAESIGKTFELLREERGLVDLALAFSGISAELKPEAFKQISLDPKVLEQRRAEFTQRLAAKAQELRPFESALDRWMRTVVAAARTPALAARLPDGLAARIDETAKTLVVFAPWFSAFPEWMTEQNIAAAFGASEGRFADNAAFRSAHLERRRKNRLLVEGAAAMVNDTMWPYPPTEAPVTVSAYLESKLDGVFGDGRIKVVLHTAAWLYFRLIGQLAAQGEELERALAPEPPPLPAARA